MSLWLLLLLAFFLQEGAFLSFMLALAWRTGINLTAVHILYFGMVLFDTWIGMLIGNWIGTERLKRFSWTRNAMQKAEKIKASTRELWLFAAAIVDFPYLNGLIGAWLEVSPAVVFGTTLAGNLVYYTVIWLLVLGILNLQIGLFYSLGLTALAGLTITLVARSFFNRLHQ